MRFIVDTGCGSNLISVKYLQDTGMVDRMSPLAPPSPWIRRAASLKPSARSGSPATSCIKGEMEAIVTPESPCAISADELCMDHGYSIHRVTGRAPHLLLPRGRRLELSVEGKTLCLTMNGRGA
eukprot:3811708-Pyramimonas_sp.AAC.1